MKIRETTYVYNPYRNSWNLGKLNCNIKFLFIRHFIFTENMGSIMHFMEKRGNYAIPHSFLIFNETSLLSSYNENNNFVVYHLFSQIIICQVLSKQFPQKVVTPHYTHKTTKNNNIKYICTHQRFLKDVMNVTYVVCFKYYSL